MANDLFAPPTADELAEAKSDSRLFAPPTQDEIQSATKVDFSSVQPDINKEFGGYGKDLRDAAHAMTDAGGLPIADNIPVIGPAAVPPIEKGGHALAAALTRITPDAMLGPAAKGKTWRQLYDQLNAQGDADKAAYAQNHPTATKAAELAGAAFIPVAPELSLAGEGASTLAKVGELAANSAIRVGGNTAVSAADAAARGHDPVKAAKRAASIAGVLEVAGLGARGLGKLGGSAGEVLDIAGSEAKSLAEQKAFKAAVGNQSKAYNEASERGLINARGRELLDEGTVGFGDSARQIASKAAIKAKEAGEKIGALLKHIDDNAPAPMVSGKTMADELRTYAGEIGGSGNKALVTRLHEAAEDLESRGNMTFAEAQKEKDSWVWEAGSSVTKVAARRIKGIIGDEMESAVGRLNETAPAGASAQVAEQAPDQFSEMVQTSGGRPTAQPGSAVFREGQAVPEAQPSAEAGLNPVQQQEIYQKLKSQYGTNLAAKKDATVTANRYDKNNSMSLDDKAAVVAGMALNPHGTVAKIATGAATGVANKLLRKRGNSAAAVGLDKIGDILKATPEFFGKYAAPLLESAARGDHSLAVTHYLLMQQDPGYQELVGGH